MPSLRSAITVYLLSTWHAMLTHTKFQEVDNNLQMCSMKTADLGHKCLLEQLTELTAFASPSKSSARNKEKKKTMTMAKYFALHANAVILHLKMREKWDLRIKKNFSDKHWPWESLFSPEKSNAVVPFQCLLCRKGIKDGGNKQTSLAAVWIKPSV